MKVFKHTITITFETNGPSREQVGEVAADAFAQLESLTDTHDVFYSAPDFTVETVQVKRQKREIKETENE